MAIRKGNPEFLAALDKARADARRRQRETGIDEMVRRRRHGRPLSELMLVTKELISVTFGPLPPYPAAACIYWLSSAFFEMLQRRTERRLNRAHQQH